MFEDLIVNPDNEKMKMYICSEGHSCNAEYCLHKIPHGKTELGRPTQPEIEPPCDCSVIECNYLGTKIFCIPV